MFGSCSSLESVSDIVTTSVSAILVDEGLCKKFKYTKGLSTPQILDFVKVQVREKSASIILRMGM